MNRKMTYILIAFTMVISLLSVSFVKISSTSADATQQFTEPQTTTIAPFYIIKEYRGRIAVFISTQQKPMREYDTYVDTLPDKDKELLKNGIVAMNDEELRDRIEDYTS
ncbi:MAG: hypothetical protein GX967_03850 [Clostridiales bacterium]|mgnify:CR=1 FL=1|nr:hypothetical protein [Clostridiales bacterium]